MSVSRTWKPKLTEMTSAKRGYVDDSDPEEDDAAYQILLLTDDILPSASNLDDSYSNQER